MGKNIYILFLISSSYGEKVQYICSRSLKRKSNKTLTTFYYKTNESVWFQSAIFSTNGVQLAIFSKENTKLQSALKYRHASCTFRNLFSGKNVLNLNHGKNSLSFSLKILFCICCHVCGMLGISLYS